MKLEIYQIGKVPPLTVIECDDWSVNYRDGYPIELEAYKVTTKKFIIAIFLFKNIAGFKVIEE
jgi:hypothetical protein